MKSAIVTGAANGIGAAIAKRLAADRFAVALLDRDVEQAKKQQATIEAAGGTALALECDVGDAPSVASALNEALRRLGTPTALVNNAGIGGPFHRIDEVSDEEWDSIIATNLKSVFLFSRKLLPLMKAQGHGRILNIASIQGLVGAARSSTYVASKHGMIGYTKAIAVEWGAYGITCNAICPGYVETSMGARSSELERVLERTPVHRVATPEEIAAMVAHLAGPESGYVNGAAIVMDGGITAHSSIT